jgi:beta-galactosidase
MQSDNELENEFKPEMKTKNVIVLIGLLCLFIGTTALAKSGKTEEKSIFRQRISINDNWSFYKYDSISKADNLIYDVRPEVTDNNDNKVADAKPTEAVKVGTTQEALKPWILPTGNHFIKDPQKRHIRPEGNPGGDFPFVQSNFNDSSWEKVNLPHDWAIKGPFQKGWNSEVGGGNGTTSR